MLTTYAEDRDEVVKSFDSGKFLNSMMPLRLFFQLPIFPDLVFTSQYNIQKILLHEKTRILSLLVGQVPMKITN